MPRFDQTGPLREGPMTGRRMGNCNPSNLSNSPQADENTKNEVNNFTGRGLGAGRGFRMRGNRCGRGFGMGRSGFGKR
ncbi:MAG TPA: DUF5320 domain-containing protein [Bacteroidales bacterium]|nr:DUF5320 domain-containing protein [Bacteroidales bacterium]